MKILFLLLSFTFYNYCFAQDNLYLIRDQEIEDSLNQITKKILRDNKLNNDIKIYVVNSSEINAFTFGDNKIFIHSALITKYRHPCVISGVIAHELGHILAKHNIQRKSVELDLKKSNLIGTIIGIAGGIITGDPSIFVAATLGNSSISFYRSMKYSRAHENEADNIAVKLLENSGFSSDGLIELLNYFSHHEQHINKTANYAMSHPLGSWRIKHINNIMSGNLKCSNFPANLVKIYSIASAKLDAYTNEYFNTSISNNDFERQYAKIIILLKQKKLQEAYTITNDLLKDSPYNPYLYELLSQILIEQKKYHLADKALLTSLKLSNNADLINFQYAINKINQAYLIQENNLLFHEAIIILEKIKHSMIKDPLLYHYLSICYGRTGKIIEANIAIAEKFYYLHNYNLANNFITKAIKQMKENDYNKFHATKLQQLILEELHNSKAIK